MKLEEWARRMYTFEDKKEEAAHDISPSPLPLSAAAVGGAVRAGGGGSDSGGSVREELMHAPVVAGGVATEETMSEGGCVGGGGGGINSLGVRSRPGGGAARPPGPRIVTAECGQSVSSREMLTCASSGQKAVSRGP